jgi:Flp pilus assembly protein TadD
MLKITKTGYHEYQKEITVSSDKTTEILANLHAEKTLATQQKEAKEWFEKAYSANTIALKIEYYNKAIELDPKYTYAYNNRGDAYDDLGEYQKAIVDYNKAIELDPKYTYAYNNRGIAYYHLGEYQKAIDDYSKAIELYNNRGIAYRNLGEYQKAIDDYNKAIKLDPKYTYAYNNRGIAYYHLGEYQKAIDDYSKAIELDPKYTNAYNNREIAYKKLGEYQNAKCAISLTSTPSGATIYIDGGYKGATPKTIKDIPPGSHTLKITKFGYEDVTKVIKVIAGKTTSVSVDLVPIFATIEVSSIPSGAEVYLNDTYKGKTPFKDDKILPATYRLKISKTDYQPWYKNVEVKSNQINKVHADLPSISGSLYVTSSPSGARIYLDGDYKGTTSKTIEDISPGSHTMKITKTGYEDWSKEIEVTTGKTTSESADLVAFPTIKLTNIPPGAQIYLDDELKGSTKEAKENTTFTLKQVPFGKHQIKVTKSGYQTFTADIDISSSKPLSLPVTLKKINTIIPLLLALILPALAIIYYLFLLPKKKEKRKEGKEEEKETTEDLPPIKKEDIPEGITETPPEQDKSAPDGHLTLEYQQIQEKMEEQANIRSLFLETQEKAEKAMIQAREDKNSSRLSSLKDLKQKINDLSQQFEYGKLPSEKVNHEVKLIKSQMKELSKKRPTIKGIKPKELNKKTREIREKKRE